MLTPLSQDDQDAYLVRFSWSIPACTPASAGSITAVGGTTVCQGDALALAVSGSLNGNTAWAWTSGATCNGDGLGGGTSITFVPTASGSYSVRGAGGCLPGPCQSIAIDVVICTSIDEVIDPPGAMRFINELAMLRIHTVAPATLMLVDALGRHLHTNRLGSGLQELNMQQLVPGTYLAMLVYDGGPAGIDTVPALRWVQPAVGAAMAQRGACHLSFLCPQTHHRSC